MNQLEEYLVSYKSIEFGEHRFAYEIGNKFFEVYSDTDIQGASLKVLVLLNKKETHIEIDFEINGTVALSCDRCLELFDNRINIRQSIYLKSGEGNSEEDENLYFIPQSENEIDLSEFIDELIAVAIPMRRVHPENQDGEPTCINNMLDYIKNIKNEGSQVDPRWNELNKLRDGTS